MDEFPPELLDIRNCASRKSKLNPHGLNCEDLRKIAKKLGLPVAGTKNVLCQRIIKHITELKRQQRQRQQRQEPEMTSTASPKRRQRRQELEPVAAAAAPKRRQQRQEPDAAVAQEQETEPKHLGSGGYGCVVKPPFKCTPHTTCDAGDDRCTKGVSKIMSSSSAAEEVMKFQELELPKIDSGASFHIKKPHLCRPRAGQVRDIKKLCGTYHDAMLIYDYGGISLHGIMKNGLLTPEQILLGLLNIFYGVKEMNAVGSYHMDIKAENIVMKVNEPKPVARLIDFGLGIKLAPDENLTGHTADVYSEAIYFAWPAELYMFVNFDPEDTHYEIVENIRARITKFLADHHRQSILSSIKTNDPVNYAKLTDIDLYVTTCVGLMGVPDGTIIEKADVYSLGMLLLDLLRKPLVMSSVLKKKIREFAVTLINPVLSERLTPKQAFDGYRELLISESIH